MHRNRKHHTDGKIGTLEKQRSMNGGEAWIGRQARTTNCSGSISQLRFVRWPRIADVYIRVCNTDVSRNIQFRDSTPAIEDVTQFNDDVKRLRIEIQEGHETP